MNSLYMGGVIFQVMVDPDAPSPSDPYLREHLHWFVSLKIPYRLVNFQIPF